MDARRNKNQSWDDRSVVEHLLSEPEFVEWRSSEFGAIWIHSNGREYGNADDDDLRFAAVNRFIDERGVVTRQGLLSEFEQVE